MLQHSLFEPSFWGTSYTYEPSAVYSRLTSTFDQQKLFQPLQFPVPPPASPPLGHQFRLLDPASPELIECINEELNFNGQPPSDGCDITCFWEPADDLCSLVFPSSEYDLSIASQTITCAEQATEIIIKEELIPLPEPSRLVSYLQSSREQELKEEHENSPQYKRRRIDVQLEKKPKKEKKDITAETFEEGQPDIVFDTSSLPLWKLLTGKHPGEEFAKGNGTSFVTFIEYLDEPEHKKQRGQIVNTLFDEFRFPKLEEKTCTKVIIHVEEIDHSQIKARTQSPPITLIHDGLKDRPSVISPDVFFFPQMVVIKHLKNCNSKATLSKRHKSKRQQEGGNWCRTPKACNDKGKCSCQAYPSRHIKKGLRLLQAQLKKHNTPTEVLADCKRLYKMVATSSARQCQWFPDYNSFLDARIERWRIFLLLKRHSELPDTNDEIKEMFQSLWDVSQSNITPIIFD